jgi:hypothetical protein
VSLTAIGSAFVIVAALFVIVGMVAGDWGLGTGDSGPTAAAATRSMGTRFRAVWLGAAFEALILILLAALWFGSLGSGGWVTLFLLLGALPAGDRWVRRAGAGAPARGEAWLFVASLLKYLLAGLVCVWRLT